ncbi:MAG: NUDIX domain-containing protein [Candidatus Nanoarchaeia archaeon]|nr:NUDIX domain-containing protein [Candidatus Nanoarchaeia archaeon]
MKLCYRKGVFVVVYKKKKEKIKYLILKRKLHWNGYEFPKGGIEKGESLIKTVRREVSEETKEKPIRMINLHKKGKFNYPKTLRDRPKHIGQEYSLFAVEVKGNKTGVDKREHSSYKWLDYNKARKLITWKNQKECLKIVNNKLNAEARIRT